MTEENQTPEGEMPAPSLGALIQILYLQGMIAAGESPLPQHQQEKPPADLEALKFHADLLAVIQAKTEGNRDEEENEVLDYCLHQLRTAYLQAGGNQEI